MRKYNVQLNTEAEDDLFEIYRYVVLNDSAERTERIFKGLKRACSSLRTLPRRGHVPPELREIGVFQFLEIRYKPYRICYNIEGTTIFIHCVLDGRRDMQSLLAERLLR